MRNSRGSDWITDEVHETFARLALQNPIAAHFIQTPERRATRFSDLVSQTELHSREICDVLYRPLGIEHQIACTLPAPAERILGVVLSRGRRDFSDRERDRVNLMRPTRSSDRLQPPAGRGLTARQVGGARLDRHRPFKPRFRRATADLRACRARASRALVSRARGRNRSQAAQIAWEAHCRRRE